MLYEALSFYTVYVVYLDDIWYVYACGKTVYIETAQIFAWKYECRWLCICLVYQFVFIESVGKFEYLFSNREKVYIFREQVCMYSMYIEMQYVYIERAHTYSMYFSERAYSMYL